MPLPIRLMSLLDNNNGIVTNRQAAEVGLHRERLRQLAKSGALERVAAGIFIAPEALPDKMYMEQQRKPKIVYSHETALFLHDLTDRDPLRYSVTLPGGYNTSVISGAGFKVFTVKREHHQLGVISMKTVYGNTIRVYSLERTICDCIRSRNKMDIAVVADAMKRYAKRNDKNLNSLMGMATLFRITKPLRSYLEVLL